MSGRLAVLSLIGGAAAFGASSAVLALMGLGIPFIVAALLAAICAGLLIYGAGRLTPASPIAPHASADLETRIRQLEETSSHLRHDLRGVLSPALMMADRLLKHEDPAIRRAGPAGVRAVQRATGPPAGGKEGVVAGGRATAGGAAATPPPAG